MLIIMGPDHSGKTTLAKKLNLPYYHFDRDSKYEDYLDLLTNLRLFGAVLDRHIMCEYPYSTVMNRKFAFTMKQWHNVILLTLIQNPLVILCTHKPSITEYPWRQYLPYNKWDACLSSYRRFLNTHHITHLEYDYAITSSSSIDALALLEAKYRNSMAWWKPMWEAGYGCMGSPNPKVLLVAERLGPNNLNNLPFETGPTGYMLTDMLTATGTPLGKFAVTNLVKSFRRDSRPPEKSDLDMLQVELEHLKPEKVVFMGSVAKHGEKVARDLGIDYTELTHFGYYHYKGITDMRGLHAEWKKVLGIVPTLSL